MCRQTSRAQYWRVNARGSIPYLRARLGTPCTVGNRHDESWSDGKLVSLRMNLEKSLAFYFRQLRMLCKMISDDSWAEWQAMAILGVTQILIILSLVFVAIVGVGHSLFPAPGRAALYLFAFGLTALIFGLDHMLLTRGNRWKRFLREFENHSRRTRVMGAIATVLIVILTFTGAFWSATVARHVVH